MVTMPATCERFAHHKDLCSGSWYNCEYVELVLQAANHEAHLEAYIAHYRSLTGWVPPTVKILWNCLHQPDGEPGEHWITIRKSLCSDDLKEAVEGLGRKTIRRACLAMRKTKDNMTPAVDLEEEQRMAHIVSQFGQPCFRKEALVEQTSKEKKRYMLGVLAHNRPLYDHLERKWIVWNKWCVGANANIDFQDKIAARRFEMHLKLMELPHDPSGLRPRYHLSALPYVRCLPDHRILPLLTDREKQLYHKPAWVTDPTWGTMEACWRAWDWDGQRKRKREEEARDVEKRFRADSGSEGSVEARLEEMLMGWKAEVVRNEDEGRLVPEPALPSSSLSTFRDVIDLTGDQTWEGPA